MFLLSPARCGGKRAAMLVAPSASFDLACRLRAGEATLGEVFTFASGLYFRGKLTYSERFAHAGDGPSVLIITPTRGLLPPAWPVTVELIREFAHVDVQSGDPRFRAPLDRDLAALEATLPHGARVVLLGSIATSKYVEPLVGRLGARLHYPSSFVGRGDMSRGGLLLRAAERGVELEYRTLEPTSPRRGQRPPRLEPRRPSRQAVLDRHGQRA